MSLKDKRIVITGGAGFIGGHLCQYLSEKGARVWVVDIKEKPREFPSKVQYIKGDARNKHLLEKVLWDADICYHLAAIYGGGKFIHDNPALILSYNLELLTSVFEAAAKRPVKRIIFPSSALVYHESQVKPAVEDDVEKYPPTKNPYGFMKLVGEYFCYYFWRERRLPFTIVRMFNVYGAGDEHFDHVVPSFARCAVLGQPFPIIGDGSETRTFTHVSDIVRGLAQVADSKLAENQTFNLSGEQEISIIKLAKILWKLSGEKTSFKVKFQPMPSSLPAHRLVSSAKIAKTLGWRTTVSLEDGLKEVVEWIRTSK